MKFRKKPVVIEAIQFTESNPKEAYEFIHGKTNIRAFTSDEDRWADYEQILIRDGIEIKTLEGVMIASINDWIIKGIQGEFYPCKPDIFDATYEPVK